ncbi:MAG TPA: type I-U CRISPR-associated RAMP protein Csb1/Cas7u [Bryobacteraceae bacterium]|nr:type I-U CRISPR-associated RAMP protein Csb1/Cas7u [Bryobacteraceae bacterium]
MMDWKNLLNSPRVLLVADLEPALGQRFQPTGFADLGAAEYATPDGSKRMLLVESAQSVANRLEKTCLDGDGPDIAPDLSGLPYVAATLRGPEGTVRTSSLVEAHRIGSPYFLLNKQFKSTVADRMAYNAKRPLDWKKIYETLFHYDPNSLIHGVFLSLLEGGRVRTPRALTGFIEAENVQPVVSGGVKNSPVDPKGELQVADSDPGEKGIYSNVPYARVEYVASSITAYFNLDLALIRGYGLPETATHLLMALALLKVRRFLGAHLRLRTACDLRLRADVRSKAPIGFVLSEESVLLEDVKKGIAGCGELFAKPPVTELETVVKIVRKKEDQAAGASAS